MARTPGITQPYGTDFVHLSMATVSTFLGACVAIRALVGFGGVFSSFVAGEQLLAPASVLSD